LNVVHGELPQPRVALALGAGAGAAGADEGGAPGQCIVGKRVSVSWQTSVGAGQCRVLQLHSLLAALVATSASSTAHPHLMEQSWGTP
jgi:hypothetical protein